MTQQVEMIEITDHAIQNLRSQLQGSVYIPGDDGYDESRQAWNLAVDQHPAVIVEAESAADIAAAVQFSAQHNLGVAVQSTGHGIGRWADGCMLIRTSKLDDVQVDANQRTAYIGAGNKWGAVLEKAQSVGLAPLLGSSPEVGVAGYTLGGGMGWLARKYGLALDSVNFFDVITADSQQLRISERENPDLFWAMRGGGGAFAALAGMQIRLYPVTTVYAGNLVYAPEDASEVFSRYREWVKDVPDELTSSIVLMNFPPFEMVPEIFRGKTFAFVRGCWCGDLAAGEQLLNYWRSWKKPVYDFWSPIPFSQAATISNDPVDPMPSFSNSAWLKDLDDETIATVIDYTLPKGGPPALVFSEVRHAGGAIARVPAETNAYSNRQALFNLEMIGINPIVQEHSTRLLGELKSHLTGGVYMNFLEGENVVARTREAYPPQTFKRLQAIKAEYDPNNMFRFGFGIEPQG